MSIPSKRDVEIIRATIRRITVGATLASEGKGVVPLASFQHAMVMLDQDAEMHETILRDVAIMAEVMAGPSTPNPSKNLVLRETESAPRETAKRERS